jgi:hypothetical protein
MENSTSSGAAVAWAYFIAAYCFVPKSTGGI